VRSRYSQPKHPNDPNFTGAQEKGNAIYDQRNRFVLSGFYTAPWKFRGGGVATLGSGLPYNFTTGTTNGGDTGATTDRPVVDGVVVGRNAGRGRAIYSFDPFIERPFALGSDRVQLDLRAEAFNVFNHANFVGYVERGAMERLPAPASDCRLPALRTSFRHARCSFRPR